MATGEIKKATFKKKDGTAVYFKTCTEQVVGFSDAVDTINAAITANTTKIDKNTADIATNATAIQKNLNDIATNAGSIQTNATAIQANADAITAINAKIPSTASAENQLATKGDLADQAVLMQQNYVTADAAGAAFATKAALTSATSFFHAGTAYTPKKNDYAMVLENEDDDDYGAIFIKSDDAQAPWQFKLRVNKAPLTHTQVAAIDSGITAAKVAAYDQVVSDIAAGKFALATDVDALNTVYWYNEGDAAPTAAGDDDLLIEVALPTSN